ncbi:hypothetical protein [Corynebacterium sp.]|nr:hypothetical protein [Corynebacterium sp.]MDO5031053.1 hypothetical protein [Corynebacterium sp.]
MQSPVWAQMTVLVLVAVPAAVVLAWGLMWLIDATWRRLRPAD